MANKEKQGDKYIYDSHRYYAPWKNGHQKNPRKETFDVNDMMNSITSVPGSYGIDEVLKKKSGTLNNQT